MGVYETAHDISIATGIASTLRKSITLASMGKIVIPVDLCKKYGVQNPRYLLSFLGQGDNCQEALRNAVHDMVTKSLAHLDNARSRRDTVLQSSDGLTAVKCFLPAI